MLRNSESHTNTLIFLFSYIAGLMFSSCTHFPFINSVNMMGGNLEISVINYGVYYGL